jgi:hypothetical protein
MPKTSGSYHQNIVNSSSLTVVEAYFTAFIVYPRFSMLFSISSIDTADAL